MISKNDGSRVNGWGKKGLQKILSFLPFYLFSLIYLSSAIIMYWVRFLIFIPSTLLSIFLTRSFGNRIVTFCNSRFSVFPTILHYLQFRITHLNINTCNMLHLFARQLDIRSGSAWTGIY